MQHEFLLQTFDNAILLKVALIFHILQKAQVTSNKMEPKKRHHFLAQFFMAFRVVGFVLFRLLAFGTIIIEASHWLMEEY